MGISDPLLLALRKHQPTLELGGATKLDRAALSKDLESALARNSQRFYVLLGTILVTFLIMLTLTILFPTVISPKWLLSGTGVFAGGYGAALTGIVRSWWRTDTLLTVCKYADQKSLDLIIAEILKAEAGRAPRRRAAV